MNAIAIVQWCSACQGFGEDPFLGDRCTDCEGLGGFDIDTQKPVRWIDPDEVVS